MNFDDDLLETCLDKEDIPRVKSNEFFEHIMEGLAKILTADYSTMVNFFHTQKEKINYFRKSVIVNECIEAEDMDWFRFVVSTIFFRIAHGDCRESYKKIEKSNWHFVTNGLYDKDATLGAFIKATQRAMVSNIALPPIIEGTTISVDRDSNMGFPGVVVYIGILIQ